MRSGSESTQGSAAARGGGTSSAGGAQVLEGGAIAVCEHVRDGPRETVGAQIAAFGRRRQLIGDSERG